MAIQLVTRMALNLGGLHSVYERGARGFDVAGYQLMMTSPVLSYEIDSRHSVNKMRKLLRKNLCILLVECREPVINNAQNEQYKLQLRNT